MELCSELSPGSEQRQISFVQIEDRNLQQILKPYLFLKRRRPPFAQEEVLFLRKIQKKGVFPNRNGGSLCSVTVI